MKLTNVLNYFVVFLLSATAAGLYLSSSKAKNKNILIELPSYINIKINGQSLLTRVTTSPDHTASATQIILNEKIDFKAFVSPIYAGFDSNYFMAFFESSKSTVSQQDIHFVILKKYNDSFKAVATFKVNSASNHKIQLAYGSIEFMQQDDFNINVLKLAQTLEPSESFQ